MSKIAKVNGKTWTVSSKYNGISKNSIAKINGIESPTNPPLSTLVAWWSMNETSGTRNDSHTNALHLTDVNTVGYTTGKVSNAANFARASSEQLTRADEAALDLATYIYICGWIYSTGASSADTGIVHKSAGTYAVHLAGTAGANDHKMQFYIGSTLVVGATLFNDSAWHFFECTYDGANMYIYVDRNQDGTGAKTGAIPTDGSALYIGGRNAANTYHNGYLDEVAIFNAVPTDAQRDWLYNSGNGRAYSEMS